MITSRKITLLDWRKVKGIYISSFPKAERMPMLFMFILAFKKKVDFYGFYDSDKFIGFIYLIKNTKFTFVMYLATDSKMRSQGYGTKILNWLKKESSTKSIILTIEEVKDSYNDYSTRLKRRNFYFRNGFKSSGFLEKFRGEWFEVLYTGAEFSKEDYINMFLELSHGKYIPELVENKVP